MKCVAQIIVRTLCAVLPVLGAIGGEEIKPLSSYPEENFVWLGTYGGEIKVDPVVEFVAFRSGEVKWTQDDGAKVEKDEVIFLSGAAQIAESARQLELDEASVALQQRQLLWKHQEEEAGLREQVSALHAKFGRLELTPEERKLLGTEMEKRLTEEKRKLDRQLALLNEKLDPALRAADLENQQEQINLDIRKSRTAHEDLVRAMEGLAPEKGILQIGKTGYVRTNDPIGSVQRQGFAAASLVLVDPVARAEAPESLRLMVDSSTGRRFTGTFSHIDQAPGARMGTAIYHFNLDPEADRPIPADLSGERMVTLVKVLEQEARIIPKAPYLFSHAHEIQKLGWAEFAKKAWNGAEVIYIGPRNIALIEKP